MALALGIGIGGYSLTTSGDSQPAEVGPVAAVAERTPPPAPSAPAPEPEPEPTLHGAAPVFKAPEDAGKSQLDESEAIASSAPAAATSSNTGNPATDTISSSPAARPAEAATSSASPSAATDSVDGPPAGPAAIAVARKFAATFVQYETGADEGAVREGFDATATEELRKALMRRPPRQPAGVEVPKAKVLNVVAAPSHGEIYPLSVSLLRVGVTSELRLEMEKLKDQGWRVTNVLG